MDNELREALDRYDKHPGLSLADDADLFVDAARRVAKAPTRQAFQRRVEHVEDGESSLSIPAWITEIGHDRPFIIIELGITEDTP